MIDTSTLGTALLTFLGGLVSGIIIKTEFWWNSKSPAEKIDTIQDGMKIIEDGKIEPAEIEEFSKEHLCDPNART